MSNVVCRWDALIWATVRDAGVPVVLSEDFQYAQEIEEVRFVKASDGLIVAREVEPENGTD